MHDRKEILRKEICDKANLWEFSKTIEKLIERIQKSGCEIFCSDIHEFSSLTQDLEGDNKSYIRLGLKNRKKYPIHVIWDILHEFGHHLSGKPNGNEKSVKREEKAWELGLEQLKQLPELTGHLDNYKLYQKNCLKTYKN